LSRTLAVALALPLVGVGDGCGVLHQAGIGGLGSRQGHHLAAGFLERFGFHRVSGFLYDQPTIPNSTPNSENPREYSNSILFTYEISAAFPTWIAAIIAEKLMLYTNPTMQPTYQKLSSKLHINFQQKKIKPANEFLSLCCLLIYTPESSSTTLFAVA
jgi:hypothetical protein